MNTSRLLPLLCVVAFLALSCDQSNPVTPSSTPSLSTAETSFDVALNAQRTIVITGGAGRYSVKSIADETVASVSISSAAPGPSNAQNVTISGKKIGSTSIVLQDSGKIAEITLTVSVKMMAANPSAVSVKKGSSKTIQLSGGIMPYQILTMPNSSIASATLSSSTLNIRGDGVGSTTVTVKDNSNPSNSISIPITITEPVTYTTPGSISFSSTAGNFSTTGIYNGNITNPSAGYKDGAGGYIEKYSIGVHIGQIIGIKVKSSNLLDVVAIIYGKTTYTPGTISLDTNSWGSQENFAFLLYVFNVSVSDESPAVYIATSGTFTITAINDQSASGSFQGKAAKFVNDVPVAGGEETFSDGTFSVPLIIEEKSGSPERVHEQKILRRVETLIQPYVEQMEQKVRSVKKR